MEIKTINTKRLILRKVMKKDAVSLFNNWASDIEMHKYVEYELHNNINQTKELINKWISEYTKGRLTWVIELKCNKEIIGVISASNNKLDLYETEVGFSLSTKYQHQGYAKEALASLINYLLNECKLEIIKGGCLSTNIRSANLMLSVGMSEYKINGDSNRYFIIKK